MNNFEAMKKVLEEMRVERTVEQAINSKRIIVVDSGGSEAIFYFDKNGNYLADVPVQWVREYKKLN